MLENIISHCWIRLLVALIRAHVICHLQLQFLLFLFSHTQLIGQDRSLSALNSFSIDCSSLKRCSWVRKHCCMVSHQAAKHAVRNTNRRRGSNPSITVVSLKSLENSDLSERRTKPKGSNGLYQISLASLVEIGWQYGDHHLRAKFEQGSETESTILQRDKPRTDYLLSRTRSLWSDRIFELSSCTTVSNTRAFSPMIFSIFHGSSFCRLPKKDLGSPKAA